MLPYPSCQVSFLTQRFAFKSSPTMLEHGLRLELRARSELDFVSS